MTCQMQLREVFLKLLSNTYNLAKNKSHGYTRCPGAGKVVLTVGGHVSKTKRKENIFSGN